MLLTSIVCVAKARHSLFLSAKDPLYVHFHSVRKSENTQTHTSKVLVLMLLNIEYRQPSRNDQEKRRNL